MSSPAAASIAADARATVRRDTKVISLIGAAHFLSHFYQLALPPLFPLLKGELDVNYTALGLVMTLYYASSGVCQAIAGFAVDRFGARRMLLIGLTVQAIATAGMGLAHDYWVLIPLGILAGMGNSVFHPADLALLSTHVSKQRLGRAYSVHGLSGSLGYVFSPIVIGALGIVLGWRGGLMAAGIIGIIASLLILRFGGILAGEANRGQQPAAPLERRDLVRLFTSTPIIMAISYFALIAIGITGLQTFSVTAIVQVHDVPLALATGVLTGYLIGSSTGVVIGGFLADRTTRHDLVAITGMVVAASVMGFVAVSTHLGYAPLLVLIALGGLAAGMTGPSRDLLVRAAAPAGATGKVFGFVYSGLDLGSSITPVVFGFLVDHDMPRAVFAVIAVSLALTIGTVIQVKRSTVPRLA